MDPVPKVDMQPSYVGRFIDKVYSGDVLREAQDQTLKNRASKTKAIWLPLQLVFLNLSGSSKSSQKETGSVEDRGLKSDFTIHSMFHYISICVRVRLSISSFRPFSSCPVS